MLWFKHICHSTSDRDIASAIFKYGGDAYYVFFNTLEILSKENAIEEPLITDFNTFFYWFPGISKQKLRKILQLFHETKRLNVLNSGEKISIHCPKLLELSRLYKQKATTDLQLGDKSATTDLQLSDNIEEEEEEEKKKNIYMPDFKIFWTAYPKKAGKKKAYERYKAAIKSGVTSDKILEGVKKYVDKIKADRTEEKHIKFPEGWLSDGRWDDEYTITTTPKRSWIPQ